MAAFDYAKVKDPTFFAENVLPPRASGKTYPTREEMLAGESSMALRLDGLWKFAYAKNYADPTIAAVSATTLILTTILLLLVDRTVGIDKMY